MFCKGQSNRVWMFVIGLIVLGFVAYFPALGGGFVWDDRQFFLDNPLVRDSAGLWKIWFSTEPQDHAPVTFSAFWLQFHLWGVNPIGYHLVTLVGHLAASMLLWRVLVRLSVPAAWFAAALFAVHPVCVSTVAWVSEQKNTWATMFYFVTLLCYLRFVEVDPKGSQRWSQRRWYVLALVAYIFALWSKGSVVVLPAVLLAIVWWRQGRITLKDLIRVGPFFALALGEGILTIWFQNHRAIDEHLVGHPGFLERFAVAGWVFWFYLWKSWFPLKLMAIYPQWNVDARNFTAYLPDLLLCGVFAVAWIYRKTWGRSVLFGLGTFALSLFPVLGFFRMSFHAYSRVADHLDYLALPCSIALAVGGGSYLLELAAKRLHWRRSFQAVMAGFLLAALSTMAWARTGVFKSEELLWRDAAEKNPGAWIAHSNLGIAFLNQHRFQEARDCFERALKLNPNCDPALVGMAGALEGLNQTDAASVYYERALKADPESLDALNRFGLNLMGRKKYEQAQQSFERALQLQPTYALTLQNLALVYDEMGDRGRALEFYERAMKAKPYSSDAADAFGESLVTAGQLDKGIEVLGAALELNSKNSSARAHLANALVQKGKLDEAIVYVAQNLAENASDGGAWYTMGNCRLLRGDTQGAIDCFEKACKFDPSLTEARNNLQIAYDRLKRGKGEDGSNHDGGK